MTRLKEYTIRQIYNYYAFSFLSMLITEEKVFFMDNYVVHGCKYIHVNENSARFRHEKKNARCHDLIRAGNKATCRCYCNY